MEPFEVRVRRWVEDAHAFLGRVATDPRCPEDVRREARRWQVACEHLWSHHWAHPATWEASETIGTWYFHWEPTALWEIETDEGFSLEDLMPALGRLELNALGRVKPGEVPPRRPLA
jgi:hypothetical protein